MKQRFAQALGFTLVLLLAGCSGGEGTTEPPFGDAQVVRMSNNQYERPDITIAVGTKVRWINSESVLHDVVAQEGTFKSSLLSRNQTFEHTFTSPGTYRYRCTPHSTSFTSGMVGVIRVQS